jgi:hypothetical protein
MDPSDYIAIVAAIFSGIAVLATFRIHRDQNALQSRQHESETRFTEGTFHMERNFAYEGLLVEIPSAMRFYGIEPADVEAEGLSTADVGYLIMTTNALSAFCKSKGVSVRSHLDRSDYRQRILAQPVTHRAWRFARLAFSRETREGVDGYLQDKFEMTFPEDSSETTQSEQAAS